MLHPRDDLRPLARVEGQYAAVEAALLRGRMHHAWLLCGPRGVGKSRFAYRLARRLLSPSDVGIGGSLPPDDDAARLIAARSHPDFFALHRDGEDPKPRRVIPIDEVRRLPEFFAKAPSRAPWRVALIDAIDDLNVNGANAVLKTLEEPPARGALILVSHAPGRLLETIRSRCRRLNFAPWPAAELSTWLESQDVETTQATTGAGSPGRALARLGQAFDASDLAVRQMLEALPMVDLGAAQKIVDGFRGDDGADRFATLCERLAGHIHERLCGAGGSRPPGAEAWVRVWARLLQTPLDAEALNLDRSDAFWSLVGDLRAAASASARS